MNSESKTDVRKTMRRLVADFCEKCPPEEKRLLAESLRQKITAMSEYKNAEIIFAYIPSEREADCTPVILDALAQHKKVCVPKVNAEAMQAGRSEMDFYFLEKDRPLDSQLETGCYGIREPKADLERFSLPHGACPPAQPDGKVPNIFMLVPGLAFTRGGKRLGHGKGFYDIYTERMRRANLNQFLCGVCFPCQLVSGLPTDAHDALVDCVVS